MNYWTITGYGITDDYCYPSNILKYVKKYLHLLPSEEEDREVKALKDLIRDYESNDDVDHPEVLEKLVDVTSFNIFQPVADILNKKYNCHWFEGEWSSDDDTYMLLYVPGYPWQMADGDKVITQEKLDEIFSKLLQEMGHPDIKPDFQILHYFD